MELYIVLNNLWTSLRAEKAGGRARRAGWAGWGVRSPIGGCNIVYCIKWSMNMRAGWAGGRDGGDAGVCGHVLEAVNCIFY